MTLARPRIQRCLESAKARLACASCLAGLLWRPLAAQAGGTTRDILVLNFGAMQGETVPASSGTLELVDKAGSQVLRASGASSFRVNLPEVLPENFTLEFDLIPKECCSGEDLAFEATLSADNTFARVSWGREQQAVNGGGTPFSTTVPSSLRAALPGQLTHVVVTFEGGTLKLYTNGVRLYTLSERRFPRASLLRVFLSGDDEGKGAVYLTRLRVAEGIATPVINAVVATVTGTGMLSSSPIVAAPQSRGTPGEPVANPNAVAAAKLSLFAAPQPRTVLLNGLTGSGDRPVPAARTLALRGIAGAGMGPVSARSIRFAALTGVGGAGVPILRTISLVGIAGAGSALSGSSDPAPRSVALPAVTGLGSFGVLASRVVVLGTVTGVGQSNVAPSRTVTLVGVAGIGASVIAASRVLKLGGLTGVGSATTP